MREVELHDEDCVPGQVVFARVRSFPWWPALIARSPTTDEWKDKVKSKYWVYFFNDNEGAWMRIGEMKPYTAFNQEDLLRKNEQNRKWGRYQMQITHGVVLANEFLRETKVPTENLERYNTELVAKALRFQPGVANVDSDDELDDDDKRDDAHNPRNPRQANGVHHDEDGDAIMEGEDEHQSENGDMNKYDDNDNEFEFEDPFSNDENDAMKGEAEDSEMYESRDDWRNSGDEDDGPADTGDADAEMNGVQDNDQEGIGAEEEENDGDAEAESKGDNRKEDDENECDTMEKQATSQTPADEDEGKTVGAVNEEDEKCMKSTREEADVVRTNGSSTDVADSKNSNSPASAEDDDPMTAMKPHAEITGYRRSKRKRTKSTKLVDFVDPTKVCAHSRRASKPTGDGEIAGNDGRRNRRKEDRNICAVQTAPSIPPSLRGTKRMFPRLRVGEETNNSSDIDSVQVCKHPRTERALIPRAVVRRHLVLWNAPADATLDTEDEEDIAVRQALHARAHGLPTRSGEVQSLVSRVHTLESLVKQMLDERKAEQTAQTKDCVAPTSAQALLKVSTELMHVAVLQVARECDYKPEETAQVLAGMWPQQDANRTALRAMATSLVWDAQARGNARRAAALAGNTNANHAA